MTEETNWEKNFPLDGNGWSLNPDDVRNLKAFTRKEIEAAEERGANRAVDYLRIGKWVSNHCYTRSEIDSLLEEARLSTRNN